MFQKTDKFIKKFIKKELSLRIKKEYFSELTESHLIISSSTLINQKNSFTRKQIDQDLLKIILEEGRKYINRYAIKAEEDTGYYLKKLTAQVHFQDKRVKLFFYL